MMREEEFVWDGRRAIGGCWLFVDSEDQRGAAGKYVKILTC